MEDFTIQQSISPIALAKAEKTKRIRARNKITKIEEESNWYVRI
jgi:hypothetical protein